MDLIFFSLLIHVSKVLDALFLLVLCVLVVELVDGVVAEDLIQDDLV